MKTQAPRGSTKRGIVVSATGCDVVETTVATWTDTVALVARGGGQCARVNVGVLTAADFEQSNNALEALAVQLEALAAKVRAMKGAR